MKQRTPEQGWQQLQEAMDGFLWPFSFLNITITESEKAEHRKSLCDVSPAKDVREYIVDH